jgi:hypothetical protein
LTRRQALAVTRRRTLAERAAPSPLPPELDAALSPPDFGDLLAFLQRET